MTNHPTEIVTLLRLMAEMVIPLQAKLDRHERTISEHVETIKDLQHDLEVLAPDPAA